MVVVRSEVTRGKMWNNALFLLLRWFGWLREVALAVIEVNWCVDRGRRRRRRRRNGEIDDEGCAIVLGLSAHWPGDGLVKASLEVPLGYSKKNLAMEEMDERIPSWYYSRN